MTINFPAYGKELGNVSSVMARNIKGFTLIELLVVISIIGLLSSVILIAVNDTRIKSRDAKRKSDLALIAKALEMYSQYNPANRYTVPGTGYTATATSTPSGVGWFNYQGGINYPKSIANGLIEAGVLTKEPLDPLLKTSSQGTSGNQRQYMKYNCGNGFYVYAHLENPSPEDLATYTYSKSVGCSNLDGYGMNYTVGHK